MKISKKTLVLMIVTTLAAGCGGSNSEGDNVDGKGVNGTNINGSGSGVNNDSVNGSGNSTNNDNSGETTPEVDNQWDNATFLTYTDTAAIDRMYKGVTRSNKFYGVTDSKEVVVADLTLGKQQDGKGTLNLDIREPAARYQLDMYSKAIGLFMGWFNNDDTGRTSYGQRTTHGFKQSNLDPQLIWKTENQETFSFDAKGNFSVVHPETGCQLTATFTHVNKFSFWLDGTATACIDGRLDGKITGAGTIELLSSSRLYDYKDIVMFVDYINGPNRDNVYPLYLK